MELTPSYSNRKWAGRWLDKGARKNPASYESPAIRIESISLHHNFTKWFAAEIKHISNEPKSNKNVMSELLWGNTLKAPIPVLIWLRINKFTSIYKIAGSINQAPKPTASRYYSVKIGGKSSTSTCKQQSIHPDVMRLNSLRLRQFPRSKGVRTEGGDSAPVIVPPGDRWR